MEQRNFMDLLQARWDEGKSVCVGLDSDVAKLPETVRDSSDETAQRRFNEAIVEATCDLVCAYKPNLAFYNNPNAKYGLRDTVGFIHRHCPGVPVILDAKLGDIGNTNLGYIDDVFGFYEADAVTVHPYLGMDAMKPFLDQKDKGVIVLVRTSNRGAGEFQDLVCEVYDGDHVAYVHPEDFASFPSVLDVGIIRKLPLYQVVAQRVASHWHYNSNCAVVVGATYPDELTQVRKIVGDMPILIPGIGAQGGELESTVRAGVNSRGQGMIINSSRGIIFASDGEDFAEAARAETQKLHDEITAVLETA